MPWPMAIVASVALVRLIKNVSSGSRLLSRQTDTEMTLLTCPGAKNREPDLAT